MSPGSLTAPGCSGASRWLSAGLARRDVPLTQEPEPPRQSPRNKPPHGSLKSLLSQSEPGALDALAFGLFFPPPQVSIFFFFSLSEFDTRDLQEKPVTAVQRP